MTQTNLYAREDKVQYVQIFQIKKTKKMIRTHIRLKLGGSIPQTYLREKE
jgi:hypothetical protein